MKKKNVRLDQVVARELIPIRRPKPARVNPIKLAYDTMSAGWPAP